MRKQVLSIILAGLLLPVAAFSQQADQVRVEDPALRVLPGNAPAGGYFTLVNDSDSAVVLTGVSSPAFARGEMHESTMQDGQHIMEARPTISVESGDQMAFQPGGYHLMLMGRQDDLAVGEHVSVIIEFTDGSTLDVPFEVVPPTYQ